MAKKAPSKKKKTTARKAPAAKKKKVAARKAPASKKTRGKTAKKKTAKRTAPKGKQVAKRVRRPKSIDDYFNDLGQLKNSRHELWCQAWVQTFDELEAAQAAGFKDPEENKYAYRAQLMKRPECQRRIQEIVAGRSKDLTLNREWVIQSMLRVHNRAMQLKPITAGKDGDIVGYMEADLKVAHSTLRDLGTNLGMFQKMPPPQRPATFIFNYGEPVAQMEGDTEPTKSPKARVRQVIQGQHKRLQ